jgi:hypothetical protein
MCLKAHRNNLKHLGFVTTVEHTTLTRANEKRDYHIYEDFGQYLIRLVKPMYRDAKLDDIVADNAIFAIDSTSISISIKLCAWALGKYEAGAVKMHTVLSLGGSIPTQIHVTDGLWHDSNFLDMLHTEINAIYVADKAYVDLEAMSRIQRAGSYFIMRPKDNMRFEHIEEFSQGGYNSNVVSDYIVLMTNKTSRQLYPDELRLVKVFDYEKKEYISFITNFLSDRPYAIFQGLSRNIPDRRWPIPPEHLYHASETHNSIPGISSSPSPDGYPHLRTCSTQNLSVQTPRP